MSQKSTWKKAMMLALVGASLFGVATVSTVDAATVSSNPAIDTKSEFHNGGSALGAHAEDVKKITVLPIDRAKFWKGQNFDFEVEVKGNVNDVAVTIDGVDAQKYFNKEATLTQHTGYASYRIDQVNFDTVGAKKIVVNANGADGASRRSVNYNVVEEKAQKTAKNVILFVGDGMSMQAKEVARILSKGITEGKYNDLLSMEQMPNMALITTSGYDSIVTDSANSASAYNTGHKAVVNAMGSYANSTKDAFDDPKVETFAEIVSRTKGMSYGMVSTAAVTDATPAALTAHTRRRGEQAAIAYDAFHRDNPPAVVLGGGLQFFLPLDAAGSKRKDSVNLVKEYQDAGYQFATTATELNALSTDKPMLGLFTMNHMNVYMDRAFLPKNPKVLKNFQDQPGLVEMTKKAIDVLDNNPNGFFLMSEGGSVDKQLHTMDWQRAAYDAIELDQAVDYARKYSKAHGDNTLIIVVADHAHGISITGTYSENEGKVGREAVRVYGDAGWPTFVDANKDGFPDNPDADVTLAVQYANAPDHYENYRFQQTPTDPALVEGNGKVIANPKRAPQGARLVEGNLPTMTGETSEVHSADDVVLMAEGPGSEYFRGVMDNTEVFYGMMRALGVKIKK